VPNTYSEQIQDPDAVQAKVLAIMSVLKASKLAELYIQVKTCSDSVEVRSCPCHWATGPMQEVLLAFKTVQPESFPHLVYEITMLSETGPALLVQENYNTHFVVVFTKAFGPSEIQQGVYDVSTIREVKELADDRRVVIGYHLGAQACSNPFKALA